MHPLLDPGATITTIVKIATFLCALSFVIVIHELCHLIAARRFGVFVEEFSLGMGPKLAGFTSKKSDTKWSLRALPIGGYCMMRGEDKPSDPAHDASTQYCAKAPWQRTVICAAGPIGNLVLAYLLILVGIALFARQPQVTPPIIADVFPHSIAQRAGLTSGMKIVSVDGKFTPTAPSVIYLLRARQALPTTITVTNGTTQANISVVPAPCQNNPRWGCVGFTFEPPIERTGIYAWYFGKAPSPTLATAKLFSLTDDTFIELATETFGSFRSLATNFSHYSNQIVGPIGMGQAALSVEDLGWDVYFIFIASISFIIGIANLLPIPGLDGGRILFLVGQMIARRPLNTRTESKIHVAGLVALLTIMLITGIHDIERILQHRQVF